MTTTHQMAQACAITSMSMTLLKATSTLCRNFGKNDSLQDWRTSPRGPCLCDCQSSQSQS